MTLSAGMDGCGGYRCDGCGGGSEAGEPFGGWLGGFSYCRPCLPIAMSSYQQGHEAKPEALEGCHVCGKPPAAGVLTICEPDRKGGDNLACCDGCARNRVVVGAVRGSTTFSFDLTRRVEAPEDGGRPERKQYVGVSPRRLGNSVAASLAENAALRAAGVVPVGMKEDQCERCGLRGSFPIGVRPRLCGDCRAESSEQKARREELEPLAMGVGVGLIPLETLLAESVGRNIATGELVGVRFAELRKWLDDNLPNGRGKAVALTQLDTARLWALSVAGEGQADE